MYESVDEVHIPVDWKVFGAWLELSWLHGTDEHYDGTQSWISSLGELMLARHTD